MLDIFRSNTRSVLTYVFLGAIIVVFVISFGPGSYSKGGCAAHQAAFAAKVNGKAISTAEWERQYGQLVRLFQQQAGPSFSNELAQQLGLPRRALDQLVERELLVEEALRRGVVVTDAELARTIREMPAFQADGRFTREGYIETARNLYGSPANFEATLRDDLLSQKMLAALQQTVKVSPEEVKDAFQTEGDRVAIAFVRFPLQAAQNEQKPSDAEVKAFADANADKVKKFYEDNASRYDVPKKAKVRHILAQVGDNAPAAEVEAARKKIDAALERLKKGEDFAKVADEVTEDPGTKGKGGDLGFIVAGLLDPAFSTAALALEPNQLSEPVRSPSGWHVIKSEAVIPAQKTDLEKVKLAIAKEILVTERARKLVAEKAQAALAAAKAGKALKDLFPAADAKDAKGPKAVKLGGATIAAEETTPFTRETAFVPRVGVAPELAAAAFAANQGDVLPRVFETSAGPLVAVVTKRERPDPAQFEAQRGAVETRLRNRKENAVRQAFLDALRKKAQIVENAQLFGAAGAPPPAGG